MRQLLLCLTAILALTVVYGQTTFQRGYGGSNSDFGTCVRQAPDHGYFLAGQIYPAGLFLMKTNKNGDTTWTKNFGAGIYTDWSESLHVNPDGSCIVTGYTNTSGNNNVFLSKVDSVGTIAWTRSFGGTKADFGTSATSANNGGYAIIGNTASFGAGGTDIYLVRTSSQGFLLWTKTYGNSNGDYGYGIKQTADGGYIISAQSNYAVSLIKTDSIGDTTWTKKYNAAGGLDMGWSIIQTTDGGYVLGGTVVDTTGGANEMWLMKTDSNGTPLWSKSYGELGVNDECYSVWLTDDGGFALTGRYVNDFRDVFLVKTDANGDTLWTKIYGNFGTFSGDLGISVQQTADKGYIIAGEGIAQLTEIYLIKTDSLGNSGCNQMNPHVIVNSHPLTVSSNPVNISSGGTLILPTTITASGCEATTLCLSAGVNMDDRRNQTNIFPNPFSTQTTFQTEQYLTNASLTIWNSIGHTVRQISNLTGQTIPFHRGNLPSGLYFVLLTEDNKTIGVDKLVIIDK